MVHIFRKNDSGKVFLTSLDILGTFRKNYKLSEVGVSYEPLLEYVKSHCVFKSMFESFKLNPCCLFDYVPIDLIVGKLGGLGHRNELRG